MPERGIHVRGIKLVAYELRQLGYGLFRMLHQSIVIHAGRLQLIVMNDVE
jgi:hypothetical protein